jgi:translation initiation factor 4G
VSLDLYFAEIEKVSDDKSLSSRVRFLLKDVVDLRKSAWKPRRDVAGPKTIDQVSIL